MLIYLAMIEGEPKKYKFKAIYRRYAGLMLRVAWKILGSKSDAEDAVHQAFLSIIENFQKISDIDCPQTCSWIVIITERKALDMLKQRKRSAGEPEDGELGVELPLPGDSGLADAMARLNPRYREVLLLRYDNGYSTKEMAKMLDMKRGSVQKLILRAKEALRKILDEEGVEI